MQLTFHLDVLLDGDWNTKERLGLFESFNVACSAKFIALMSNSQSFLVISVGNETER